MTPQTSIVTNMTSAYRSCKLSKFQWYEQPFADMPIAI